MRAALLLFALAACAKPTTPKPPPPRPTRLFTSFTDAETARAILICGAEIVLPTDGGLLRIDQKTKATRRLDESDGLFGRDLVAAIESKGALWVAGEGGLATLQDDLIQDLPGPSAPTSLAPDPKGGILIGAKGGLYRYALGALNLLSATPVAALSASGTDVIVAGRGGLARYDGHDLTPVPGWEGVPFSGVARQGDLLIALSEEGPRSRLWYGRAKERKEAPLEAKEAKITGEGEIALAVGTRIYRLSTSPGSASIPLEGAGRVFSYAGALPKAPTALAIKEGSIYAALPSGGVRVVGEPQKLFAAFDLIPPSDHLLVASNKTGETFLPTTDHDVAKLEGDRFLRIEADEDPGARVLALAQGPKEEIYALVQRDDHSPFLLKEWSGSSFALRGALQGTDSLGGVRATFFTISPEGDFWIGLESQEGDPMGLLFSIKDLSSTEHLRQGRPGSLGPLAGISLPSDSIAGVRFVKGSTWIATNGGVIWCRGGKIKIFGENEGLESEIVHDVALDRLGLVWIATGSGVGVLQIGGRWNFDRYHAILGNARVRALLQSEDGTMWVGTGGGAYFWKESKANASGEWGRLTTAEGLCGNNVADLTEDRIGRVWYFTEAGVCVSL